MSYIPSETTFNAKFIQRLSGSDFNEIGVLQPAKCSLESFKTWQAYNRFMQGILLDNCKGNSPWQYSVTVVKKSKSGNKGSRLYMDRGRDCDYGNILRHG